MVQVDRSAVHGRARVNPGEEDIYNAQEYQHLKMNSFLRIIFVIFDLGKSKERRERKKEKEREGDNER